LSVSSATWENTEGKVIGKFDEALQKLYLETQADSLNQD